MTSLTAYLSKPKINSAMGDYVNRLARFYDVMRDMPRIRTRLPQFQEDDFSDDAFFKPRMDLTTWWTSSATTYQNLRTIVDAPSHQEPNCWLHSVTMLLCDGFVSDCSRRFARSVPAIGFKNRQKCFWGFTVIRTVRFSSFRHVGCPQNWGEGGNAHYPRYTTHWTLLYQGLTEDFTWTSTLLHTITMAA